MKIEFLNTAYTLFPKGLSDRSEDYLNSRENRNLNKKLQAKKEASFLFDQLGLNIINNNSNYHFENLSTILMLDRCVKGRLYSESKDLPNLLIYVSIVIPYYIFYIQSKKIFPSCIKEMNDSKFYVSDIWKENIRLTNQISLQIEEIFLNYKFFPIELLDTKVPDIVFNGNGTLFNFQKTKFANPMTFYNTFFSDTYF